MVAEWVRREVRESARGWAPYVGVAAGLFLVAGVIGAALGVERGSVPLAPFEVRGPETSAPAPALDAVDLFVNNSLVALWTVLSALLFGLPTLYIQVYNGLLLGSVTAVAAGRLGALTTVLSLAPHGVIELPAIWVAGGIGFRVTHLYWKIASGDRDRVSVPRLLGEGSLLFLGVIVALAVAAVVEAVVTPAVA